jgi:rubrerythrin
MLKSFILDEKTIEQLEHIINDEESHVVKLKELLLRNS